MDYKIRIISQTDMNRHFKIRMDCHSFSPWIIGFQLPKNAVNIPPNHAFNRKVQDHPCPAWRIAGENRIRAEWRARNLPCLPIP